MIDCLLYKEDKPHLVACFFLGHDFLTQHTIPPIVIPRKTTTAAIEITVIIVELDKRPTDAVSPSTSLSTDGSGWLVSIPLILNVASPCGGTVVTIGLSVVVDDNDSVLNGIRGGLDVPSFDTGIWVVEGGWVVGPRIIWKMLTKINYVLEENRINPQGNY